MNPKDPIELAAHWLEREGAACEAHTDAANLLRTLHAANKVLLERQADLVRHIENLIECATHHQADIRTALDEARACIRSLK